MSSIGSIGSSNSMMMHGAGGRPRPDPAQMADKLFGALDTDNQGYIEESDLASALSSISGSDSSNAADLFASLDSDSDGKVTRDEFSSALQSAASQLDAQFDEMRMQGGMPPPPPPPGDDAGFSKDELSDQLAEIGDTDSKRSSLISDIVANFDAADTDGDGKVSFKEAMAYEQTQGSASTNGSTGSTGTTSTDASSASSSDSRRAATDNASMQLMMQMMRLAQAYGLDSVSQAAASSVSATA